MRKIIAIIIFAFLIRLYGINWDQGFHLHPDERMLIMVADRIHFFDQLNPQFFNYGSLPIYLLKGVAQMIGQTTYQEMLYIGRYLSVLFDLLIILFIYKIVKIIFKNEKIALFSSFFYAIAFFPIQNAHFFTVDVFLTFQTTLLAYLLLLYVRKPTTMKVALLAVVEAAALATKITAIIFLPIILFVIFIKTVKQPLSLLFTAFYFLLTTIFFLFLFMPYAFLNYKQFLTEISAQIRMNNDAYVFPYTLQYVNTLPYFYYLKNIFLFGLGPIISIFSVIGILFLIREKKNRYLLLTAGYYLFYFLTIGRSAVKFMRYMLPIYPFLAILAGFGLYRIFQLMGPAAAVLPASAPPMNIGDARYREPSRRATHQHQLIIIFILTLSMFWTLMFINIYSQPHTRVTATGWILKNIPYGSTLAIEHWDDRLPLYGSENYNIQELTLYDQPDDNLKWTVLNQKLKQSDYIIIASNRLYIPLQRLTDCSKYKVCYPKTAEYYQRLFSGTLSFKKVAEFSVYPQFRPDLIGMKFQIDDSSADESFTVYDHPKIMIFKKI